MASTESASKASGVQWDQPVAQDQRDAQARPAQPARKAFLELPQTQEPQDLQVQREPWERRQQSPDRRDHRAM